MFFQNNRPLAGVTPFKGRNGSGGQLDAAKAEVSGCEEALAAARSRARAAAKRAGVSPRGLFEHSRFILRATGEKWHEAGRHEGQREAVDAMLIAQGLDPEKEHAEIAASIKANRVASNARSARWRALMKDAGWYDAIEAGDHELAGRIAAEMFPVLSELDCHVLPKATIEKLLDEQPTGRAQRMGREIVAAGKKARMAVQDDEVPQPQGLAAKIIEAGRRRRGEI